ncbi:transglycosylase family protein [Streptomyces sp. ISL-99]|uniref:LysM peptidoglycan-binding domain-containing protein n=1 Tax=Streptomyces sp. ISL-99 TaxID=2819193 RepID=UPI001BED196A|nr:transglycosylase family protein [Streptomyces sp. ISL-99]MBT2525879.1 transglycosylase family protein [Streptomyces sp. ISL-99]
MRSGNGRHRRPRQAPAFVVAAGVTGSAIAIPLLGATGANAAEATTWDRVADCESGGTWSADLGNGYYGGLQFSPEVWQKFGGTAYAPRADLASRSQQIQVAEKVLAEEGPQAWPSCALISGLTEGDAEGDDAASGDGGATAEPAPGQTPAETPGSSETPQSAETPAGADGGSAETGAADGTAKSADPTAPPESGTPSEGAKTPGAPAGETAAPATGEGAPKGKHRGEEAREGAGAVSGETGIDRESGRHASRGDGPTREAAKAEDAEGAEGAEGVDGGAYTVRTGDSLSAIADAHGVRGGWTALYAANEETVGSDPDLILPGQSLDLG